MTNTTLVQQLPVESYAHQSRQPLQSLFFLLPIIALYELGTLLFTHGYEVRAQSMLRLLFSIFGITANYLPGLLVIIILLTWHAASKNRWYFKPSIYICMYVESLLLAIPLLIYVSVVYRHGGALAANDAGAAPYLAELTFSLGAGIYEELVFRLMAIALIHLLLHDVIRMPNGAAATLAVVISSLAFAFYHFGPNNPFSWIKTIFYTGAGIYLAVIYVMRGFGLAAGTHAMYDIIVVTIQASIVAQT